jgi:hypothetical protein
MNLEQLEKANKIAESIKRCKTNIELAKYTQSESVVIRTSYLKFNGIDKGIEIPDSLFRVIGKLILSEHSQNLKDFEKELESM